MDDHGPILLYDGVCGLCNRLVQFILKRDQRKLFRFASLQGEFAAQILKRHGKDPANLDTVYVVLDAGLPSERLLSKAAAIFIVLRKLGGVWTALSAFGILPKFLLNFGYDVVAHNRYRVFGKSEACMMPAPEVRERFIDV